MKEIQTCPSLSSVHARPSPSCQQWISSAALLLNTDRKPDHVHLPCLGFVYSIQKSAVCIFGIISYLISYRGYCYRSSLQCHCCIRAIFSCVMSVQCVCILDSQNKTWAVLTQFEPRMAQFVLSAALTSVIPNTLSLCWKLRSNFKYS